MILRAILALAALGVAGLHGILGASDAMGPAIQGQPAMVAIPVAACWHFITAFFLVSAVTFWRGGFTATRFGALWFIFGLIFIVVGLLQSGMGGLINAPQWVLLLPIGAGVLLRESQAKS